MGAIRKWGKVVERRWHAMMTRTTARTDTWWHRWWPAEMAKACPRVWQAIWECVTPESCSCLGLNCLCLSHRDTFTGWGAALEWRRANWKKWRETSCSSQSSIWVHEVTHAESLLVEGRKRVGGLRQLPQPLRLRLAQKVGVQALRDALLLLVLPFILENLDLITGRAENFVARTTP